MQRGWRRRKVSVEEENRGRRRKGISRGKHTERAFQSTMTMCCLNAFHFGSMVEFKAYAVVARGEGEERSQVEIRKAKLSERETQRERASERGRESVRTADKERPHARDELHSPGRCGARGLRRAGGVRHALSASWGPGQVRKAGRGRGKARERASERAAARTRLCWDAAVWALQAKRGGGGGR